ncbi:hypothetical protein [Bacillus sp. NPDC094106]|uniref:hypothetical protein n=1 Tax=Bacillus sp. NPDC094106 TaxID=3363949 RepID=UPI003810D39F
MKQRKRMISLLATGVILTSGIPASVHADTEKKEIKIQEMQGEKVIPMNELIHQMGGQVQEGSDEDGDYKVFIVGDKSIKIHEKQSCAFVNGEIQPYKKERINGFTFPTYWEPIYTSEDVMVPADFIADALHIKMNGSNIEFDVEKKKEEPKDSNTTAHPANEDNKATNQLKKDSENTSNEVRQNNEKQNESKQKDVVKENKDKDTNKQPNNHVNNEKNNNQEQKNQNEPNTEQNNQASQEKVYTAPEVKQLAYSVGFVDSEKGLKFNPYGKDGDDMFIVADLFTPGNGAWDVKMFIYNNNNSINEPLKVLLNKMLPTQGNKLYSILDTPGIQSQELLLDGRKIKIEKNKDLAILFGPIQ